MLQIELVALYYLQIKIETFHDTDNEMIQSKFTLYDEKKLIVTN